MLQSLTQRIHLEKDERILSVVRKHWFMFFLKIIGPITLLVIPYAIPGLLATNETLKSLSSGIENIQLYGTFVVLLWTLLMWLVIWSLWTDYYLDVWTITNRRIIAIDQKGLFRRSISSFRYERLQELNININGIIATFLNFGTLETETAGHGDGNEFLIRGVPHPRETKALILRAADQRIGKENSTSPDSDSGV